MNSRLSISILILTCLVTAAAVAQPYPALERVQISIWPEYDRPGALVILSGWLPANSSMPGTVALPMPTAAGMPNAVAKRGADGTLLMATWTADEQGELTFVHIETDTPEVRIEFYADLEMVGATRRFRFLWPGGMEVGQLRYEVMQPLGGTGMTIDPPAAAQRLGTDGLTYFSADLGTKGPADAFAIDLTYDKTSSELTAAALQPNFPPPQQLPGETAVTESPAQDTAQNNSMWLVMLPIAFALGAIVVWFSLSGRKDKE